MRPIKDRTGAPGLLKLLITAYALSANLGCSRVDLTEVATPQASEQDNTAPVITVFQVPQTASSLLISGITLVATDDGLVTSYYLSETNASPSVTLTGWSSSSPTSFTVASAGLRSIHAWAKDLAGNVSQAQHATVLVTLADSQLKGVGGLEGEPPNWVPFTNKISNPGFEDGATGWTLAPLTTDGDGKKNGCEISAEAAHSGTHSLKCYNQFGNSWQKIFPNAPGFLLKAWIKTEIMEGDNTVGGALANTSTLPASAYFNLTTRGSMTAGTWYAHGNKIPYKGGIQPWTMVVDSFSSTVPKYTAAGTAIEQDAYTINLSRYKNITDGVVYFDDIEFIPVFPILRNFLTYPNFRGYLWNDRPQIVSGKVEVYAPEGTALSDYKVTLVIKDAASLSTLGSVTISDLTARPTGGSVDTWSWNASGISVDGEALISAGLYRKSDNTLVQTYPDWRIVKKAAAHRATLQNYVDTDNFLVRNGQKRFIWGVYDRLNYSGYGYRVTASGGNTSATKEGYKTINGFDGKTLFENYQETKNNTSIYWSPMSGGNPGHTDPSYDVINPWSDALNDIGSSHLHIMQDAYAGRPSVPPWAGTMTNEQIWGAFTSRLTSPGFLGYYTADEPSLQKWPLKSPVWSMYDFLRNAQHDRVTYAVMYMPADLNGWRELSDVVGSDPYPYGRGLTVYDDLLGDKTAPFDGQTSQWTDLMQQYTFGSRPIWMVAQLWINGTAWPNYDTMKKQAWKSIISGAHGVLWWAFADGPGMARMWYGSAASASTPTPCDSTWQSSWRPPSEAWKTAIACNSTQMPNGTGTALTTNPYYDFKRISAEVMNLEEMLVTPPLASAVSTANANIQYLVKRHPVSGKVYVISTNTKETPQAGVVFTSTTALSSVSVYSESRSLPESGKSFSDDFAPYEVHVYELTESNP